MLVERARIQTKITQDVTILASRIAWHGMFSYGYDKGDDSIVLLYQGRVVFDNDFNLPPFLVL